MPRVLFKKDDFDQIKDFIENGGQIPSREMVSNFLLMANALQVRMFDYISGVKNENAKLVAKIDKYKALETKKIEDGTFDELGFDSRELALALLYKIKKYSSRYVSMEKLQQCLYLLYANWLASHEQKICIESPVAQEKGPWFWGVAKKVNTKDAVTSEAFDMIAKTNAGVAALINNIAYKYCDYTDKSLSVYLTKSYPYKSTDKDHNGGKWNGVIQDKLIYEWKRTEKNQ